uniref:hypothetical protein n=1 Tax=Trichocoleus desertorum TaxID=1481672 RepID=UPI0025B5E98A|nr:hypothetical protein [Trichocoleus desertorum]
MTQQNILEQAKQGNAQAIAALMNRTLQPKGITAKASMKDDCLRVMLESEDVPDQGSTTAFVQRGMQGLGVESISRVQVFGRQAGEEFPSWNQEFSLGDVQSSVTQAVPQEALKPEKVEQKPTASATAKKQPSKLESVLGLMFIVFVFGGCVKELGRPWNCAQAREDLAKAEQEYESDDYEGMSGDRAYIAVRGNMYQVAMKRDKVAQKCN